MRPHEVVLFVCGFSHSQVESLFAKRQPLSCRFHIGAPGVATPCYR